MSSSVLSTACPKGPSRFMRKLETIREKQRTEREVYAAVTTRDQSCCRVCHRFCRPRAIGLLEKAHHHHLIYLSAGGKTTTENVCLLCAFCHEFEHQHRIQLSGNADLRDAVTGRLNGIKVERLIENGWRR